MHIEVQITKQPLALGISNLKSEISNQQRHAAGALAEFTGLVRGEENGEAITGLEYEAYAPMAERVMRTLLEDIGRRHPCLSVKVAHRIGLVPVGAPAIHVVAEARHRAEAFALLAEFMDRLKQDVPIWKGRAATAEIGGTSPGQPASHRISGDQAAASADEVLARLGGICPPLEPEHAPLDQAAGRILREPVRAPEDQPPFDRSAMDGFAVRLDDTSREFRLVDEIRAGDWKPRRLEAGEAVRIATGGALPGDGLQVVMKEDAQADGAILRVVRRGAARCIRFRGEEARQGDTLVESGAILQPGTLALLASVGLTHPLVTRRPRVVHLATGSEIVAPEQAPQRGQIRDSNSILVRAFLAHWQAELQQRRVAEDAAAIESAIRHPASAIESADLLLISGGASVGEHDFTRRLLEDSGFDILISKTSLRPGKPLIVARRGRTVAFGLPGNPLSHFVCLNLFVRAALDRVCGRTPPRFRRGRLAMKLESDGHVRETFWPSRCETDGETPGLSPLRWSSSGDLTALAAANALIRVPARSPDLPAGAEVEFLATLC